MSFFSAFTSLPDPPDPASRQPFTNAAILPLLASHYVLTVLAILPHTFPLKLALLPVVLWQIWTCAVGLDFGAGMANAFGLESADRLRHFNFMFMVRASCRVQRCKKKPLADAYAHTGWDDCYGAEVCRLDFC
jgi:hypothetical protein